MAIFHPLRRRLRQMLKSANPSTTPAALSGLEEPMYHAVRHLVDKGFAPKTILDVGAAKGYWSDAVSAFFPAAQFCMIDPLAESEENLRRLTKRSERFRYLLMAVGDVPGTIEMNLTPDLDGSSLMEYYDAPSENTRKVEVATLDQLLNDGRIEAPDFIKIDVQGYELKVLTGAERVLEHAEVLIIEANLFRFMPECPLAHEVIAHLADRGFVLFDIAGTLRRPFENDLGQIDLVMVRKDSALAASNRWN